MLAILLGLCQLLWEARWMVVTTVTFFASLVVASYAISLLVRHFWLPSNQVTIGKCVITDCDSHLYAILSTIALCYSLNNVVRQHSAFLAFLIGILNIVLLFGLTVILTLLKGYFTDK